MADEGPPKSPPEVPQAGAPSTEGDVGLIRIAKQLERALRHAVNESYKSGATLISGNNPKLVSLADILFNAWNKEKPDAAALTDAIARTKAGINELAPGAEERYDKYNKKIAKKRDWQIAQAVEAGSRETSAPSEPLKETAPIDERIRVPQEVFLAQQSLERSGLHHDLSATPPGSPVPAIDPTAAALEKAEQQVVDANIEAAHAAEAAKKAAEAAARPVAPEPEPKPAEQETAIANMLKNARLLRNAEKIKREPAEALGKQQREVAAQVAEQPAPAAEPQAPAGAETKTPPPESFPYAVFRKNQRGPKPAEKREPVASPPAAVDKTPEAAAMQPSVTELREEITARIPPGTIERGEGGGRENQIDHWRRLSDKLQKLYPNGLPEEVANKWGKLNAAHSTAVLAKDTVEVSRVLSRMDSFIQVETTLTELKGVEHAAAAGAARAAATEAKPETTQEPEVGEIKIDGVQGEGLTSQEIPITDESHGNLMASLDKGVQAAGAPEKPTVAESRGILKSLIDGYKWTRERFTKSKDYLNKRAKELDAKAEAGGLEKATRRFGELYNKLSLTHKLGIGVLLGVGTAVGSAVSLPLALAGLTGLVVQRAAGAASMFLQIEKTLQEKKVGESYQFMAQKERAAIDALLYTAVMGTAISEALKFVDKTETVQWWKQFFQENRDAASVAKAPMKGFQAEVRAVDNATMTEAVAKTQQVPGYQAQVRATAEAGALVTEPPGEVPTAMVQATPGKGSEWMMKRLVEQLQEKGVAPGQYLPGSDMHELLKADEKSLNDVIHRIATEQGLFKKESGENILIKLGDKLSFKEDGSLLFTNAKGDEFTASTRPSFTAPYTPGASSIPAQGSVEEFGLISERPPSPEMGLVMDRADLTRVQQTPAPDSYWEAQRPPKYVETQQPAPVEEIKISPSQPENVLRTEDGTVVTTERGEPVRTGTPAEPPPSPETPEQSAPTPEAQATSAPEASTLYTQRGEIINLKAPAIYEVKSNGQTYLFAEGGTDAERLAFVQKYQEGLAEAGAEVKPIRYTSFVQSLLGGGETRMSEIGGKAQGGVFREFLGFLSGQPKLPSPADFVRKVSP